ncbi:hypothetical protein [Sorangium sp. So ce861]|uniref:hypothetical protein n=1 Tax=Sorangium sp. So ce861 TaxID=3133323 RepID=UPI003F60A7B3
MIDVSLLGWLLVTLTSPLSLVLLVVALGSVAYIGVTALSAAPPRRGARALGTGVAACALAAGMIGLRVGSGAGAALPTAAVGIAAAAALGATAACAWTFGAAGAAALGAARARRSAAALRAGDARRRLLAASQRAYVEGDDLAAETAAADAAVERLRAAVGALEDARAALEARRDAARGAGGDGVERGAEGGPRTEHAKEASALAEDLARACDEAATRVSMGRRVLAAAEAAALRIACNTPLRRLLRRRPREAMQALATLGAGATARAAASIEAFLGEVRAARAEVAAIVERRAAGAAGGGAGSGAAEGPASVALGELAAMESAYGALLERLRLSELHASTRASVEQVESAAGALSAAARAAAIDPTALGALVTEIARAESAVAAAAPEAGGSRALAEALAEGSLALDRSDATSLSELIAALRELR